MYYIGLDLGQSADYTALAICRKVTALAKPCEYQFLHVQRFALGTSYPDIVRRMVEVTQDPRLARDYRLIVDSTGVGAPVVDLLDEANLYPVAVTITGGTAAAEQPGGGWHVPKRDLVSSLAVLFQTERIKFAAGLPEVPTLVNELLNFKVKISAAGRDTYEAWREGIHDDLVLACALAVWYAERNDTWLFTGAGRY